jgi:hypothetical protein
MTNREQMRTALNAAICLSLDEGAVTREICLLGALDKPPTYHYERFTATLRRLSSPRHRNALLTRTSCTMYVQCCPNEHAFSSGKAVNVIARKGTMAANTDPDEAQILPVLKPIKGVEIDHPLALLTPEELIEVRKNLDVMARNRREAEASTGSIRLS